MRFVGDRTGSTATEFAISASLLVLILFAIMTFGWVLYIQNNMEMAAREGARRMAVADVNGSAGPIACPGAPGTAVEVACNMIPAASGSVTVDASDLCPGDQAVRVVVSANGSDIAVADIFGLFNGSQLSATVEMRKEAECA